MLRIPGGNRRASGLRVVLAATLLGLAPAWSMPFGHRSSDPVRDLGLEQDRAAVPVSSLATRTVDGPSQDRGPDARRARSASRPGIPSRIVPRIMVPPPSDRLTDRSLERSGRLAAPSTAPPALS
jgi:hypothetical protein